MITVISCTNRPNSNTLKIAKHYLQLLEKQGVKCRLFALEQLPHDIAFAELFNKRSENFQQLLNEFILPAQKFVLVVPEYNGSFPGILKVFLDAIHPDLNRGKKVALLGVSSGRAGNLRGMEHLTGILNYLGMHVHPNKLPVSGVLNVLNPDGSLKDEGAEKAIEKHAMDIINY
jgi:chromate reductase